jgi:hypothetical protein
VKTVLELADAFTSTAAVFLIDDRLPEARLWRWEFANTVNGSYNLRGLAVTLAGQAAHD